MELCGEDNLCWQQDYPHAIGTWPHAANAIDYCLGPIEDERLRRKLLWENIARHYRLDLTGPEEYAAQPVAAASV
jgi:predicted TIM-barrel fold metal-dependent hydrolase